MGAMRSDRSRPYGPPDGFSQLTDAPSIARTADRAPFYGTDYDDDGNPVPEAGAQLVNLADVEPERVEWLWAGHLPLSKVVVLDGDPGVGKSAVSLDIAARVSVGAPMPDGLAGIRGGVLVLSAEDGLEDTIRPRIDAAGGNPAAITAMTGFAYPAGDGKMLIRPAGLPCDLPAIEAAIIAQGVVLVIVDVLMAYLGDSINSHRDQDIRRALGPLAAMAGRCHCCVLVLRHLNKATGASAIYRGGGSIGIAGAARAVFMCGVDPEDEARHVLAPVKCNLSAMPPAMAYRLAYDERNNCVRVAWLGESARRSWELLGEGGEDERGDRDEAAEWLTGYLTEAQGEARAADVIKAARADGIAERTLKRARKRAGVTSQRSGFGQGSVWRLPSSGPHPGHTGHTPGDGTNGLSGGPNGQPELSFGHSGASDTPPGAAQ